MGVLRTRSANHSRFARTLLFLVLVLAPPVPLWAGDWYVDDDGNCAKGDGSPGNPFCLIQNAIDAAFDGDVVLVATGTYLENIDFLGKAIEVRSDLDGDPATIDLDPVRTVIDGNHAGTVVSFQTGEPRSSQIRGFTITRGNSSGIVCEGSSPTIQDNFITGNTAATGAGVSVRGGAPLMERNTLEGNSATDGGGGIHCLDGSLIIRRDFISNNDSRAGGGIGISGSSVAIEACRITDNQSSGQAGGINVAFDSVLNLVGSLVVGNVSPSIGGGLSCTDSELAVLHCTFSRNQAAFGGALGMTSSNALVTDSVFWADVASILGPELYLQTAGVLEIQYSDVEGGEAEAHAGRGTTLIWGPGMIDIDPLFEDSVSGDYALQSSSPCVDAGNPAANPGGRDLAGNPRFLDGDLDRVMALDMGAYEFNNVHLAITGDATPGGTLTFETTGKPGLIALLFVGAAPGEVFLKPYGLLFLDVSQPYEFFPFAVIPDTKDVVVPPGLQGPLDLVLQELGTGLRSRAGNFSNAVELRIE